VRGRIAPTGRQRLLLLGLACVLAAVVAPTRARAQAGPPQARETKKIDEYGKIGHCDETARLDNFAIELQNDPGLSGYLLVYVGENDLPSWTQGILRRAADYLVSSRGLDAGRLKVIDGGYREERTTELWVVPEHADPPRPSNTVEHELDRTKAYQWDEDAFDVEFNPDDAEPAAAEEGEGETDAAENAPAAASAVEAESAEEARWRKEFEKYHIGLVSRGVIEDEPQPEEPAAGMAESGKGAAVDAAQDEEGPAEPAGAPAIGEIKIGLWWNVEKLADELKAVPDARVCLVYYWGVQNATRERAKELVERAVARTEEQLGLKRDRILVIDGGRSYDPGVELWVVPRGAQPPRPRPGQKRKFGFYTMPGEE
jgi:hypothetical protein